MDDRRKVILLRVILVSMGVNATLIILLLGLNLISPARVQMPRHPATSELWTLGHAAATYRNERGHFPRVESWAKDLIDGGFLQPEDVVTDRGSPTDGRDHSTVHYAYFELPAERWYDSMALLFYENPAHFQGTELDGWTFAVFADGRWECLPLDMLSDYISAQVDYPHVGVAAELLQRGSARDVSQPIP